MLPPVSQSPPPGSLLSALLEVEGWLYHLSIPISFCTHGELRSALWEAYAPEQHGGLRKASEPALAETTLSFSSLGCSSFLAAFYFTGD